MPCKIEKTQGHGVGAGTMNRHVIIVAGGKGLRMGADVPKQFIPIGGLPVLMRTIDAFRSGDAAADIILVLPESQFDYWRALCQEYRFDVECRLVAGGRTRFHSVQNGLALVSDDGLVAVHDGVRPFVSAELINSCFDEAEHAGAAIPVTDVVETLRHKDANGASSVVPRGDYCLVQTPQVFRTDILKQAYRQDYSEAFTDDASVVEAAGYAVALVGGCRDNIKITTPSDLAIAEALLSR